MKKRSPLYLVSAANEIQQVSALEARSVIHIPRMLANASFPTRRLPGNEFVRRNGDYELTLLSPSSIGLPYGTYPRLIIAWITHQSKITRSRTIHLGDSINAFLKNLEKSSSGGTYGSMTSLREQCKRLFSCNIQWTHNSETSWSMESLRIAQKASMIWQPNEPGSWEAYLTLDQGFFDEIQQSAIPVDRRVLQACSHYPLAIDIYSWLTLRNFRNNRGITLIPWDLLALQFANSYSRESHFRQKFTQALRRVSLFYPTARFHCDHKGVWLYPSPPHVPPMTKSNYLDSS
jgi:hypothetical protein